MTLTSIMLNTCNQKYNTFQVAIRIFLHSKHTPGRVTSALHRAGINMSQSSIERATKSVKTIRLLATLGMTILWAYDNFDILLKSLTTAL